MTPTVQTVSKLLTRAQSAARKGALHEAEGLYRDVLARFPANRRAREGLAGLRSPASKALPVTQADVDSAMALYKAGDFAAALQRVEALAPRAPDMRALLDIRGACLRAQSQPEQALEVYRKVLEHWPRDARSWRNCGTVLMDMLKLDEAEDCLCMATRLDADDLMGWIALAQCHEMRGQPRPAFDAISQALARDANHAHALNLLGRVLRDLGDLETAKQAHERARAVADATADVTQQTAAETGLGVLANATGHSADARAHYRRAIQCQPDNIQAHLNLSRLARYTPDDAHISQLSALAAQENRPLLEQAQIHFALYNALDQVAPGSDTAFDHLATANRLRRRQLRYDPRNDAAFFAHIAQLTETLPRLDPGPTKGLPRPVFIVGLPRSGTTLTEQILSAAPGVHGAGELPVADTAGLALLRQLRRDGRQGLGADDLAGFAQTLLQGLALYAPDAPVIIDKMPLNFRWTALILAALPEARVIHIRRDAVETCWSNFRTCYAGHGNGFAYGLQDLAQYHGLYQRHMDQLHERHPERLYALSYQDLTARLEEEARALVDFCQLDWSDACLHPEHSSRPVLTASAGQVRQPVYDGNQRHWQRYTRHLGLLLQGLDNT